MIDLHLGDCRGLLKTVPDASVDAVITDPPYAEVPRPYGRLTETEWHKLMREVVGECRRILKPTGSVVFILQPNYEVIGRTRPWLWEFMAWTAREWNQVEDAYWWNHTTIPHAGCERKYGLMRRSIKPCIWLGSPDCYRDQDEVLWSESDGNKAMRQGKRCIRRKEQPSGHHIDRIKAGNVATERDGGVTPFNLLPISNGNSVSSAGSHDHGAGTPEPLMDWWTRYLVPTGGTLCDPFMGSGTAGIVAVKRGLDFIGFEQMPEYFETARSRIAAELSKTALLPA